MTDNIPDNYSALVAVLHAMDYPTALEWVSDPSRGFSASQQRLLLDGRFVARCTSCSWGIR